ncbi:MAG: hypothetical protein AAF330_04850 [Pseudomonadota bacterium]
MEEVQFTHDMVETLREYFACYEVDGVVTLEANAKGLWLKNPDGSRQFLGRAVLPPHLAVEERMLH